MMVRLRQTYLEMMRAHVDEGGRLSHENGLSLLMEVERLRGADGNYKRKCPHGNPLYVFCAYCQPAPDAMREALKRQCDNMAFVVNHCSLGPTWYNKFKLELEEDRAVLTAPAPPADGATVSTYKRHWLSFLHGWFRDLIQAQKAIEAAEDAKLFDPSQHAFLSPSPAVAAEPVAWPDHPGATVDAVAFVEGVKRYPNMDRDAPDLTLADKQAACQGAFINGFKRAMEIRSPPVKGDRETS